MCWQWHTKEGVRGLRTLPLAYDLRHKRVRKRQNMVFSTTENTNIFWGVGTAPSADPSLVRRRVPAPHSPPSRRLRHLDPSHSKILGTPLCADVTFLHYITLHNCNVVDRWRTDVVLFDRKSCRRWCRLMRRRPRFSRHRCQTPICRSARQNSFC